MIIVLCIIMHDGLTQKYQWSKMVTPDDQFVDPFQKIFEGKNGNFYIGMRFFNQIGIGTPGKKQKSSDLPSLNAGARYALFIGKYDIEGTNVWNKMIRTGGGGSQFSSTMTSITHGVEDRQGNLYITGNFEKDIDFGNGVMLQSKGLNDLFIAKFDASGNAVWAKRAGGESTKLAEPGGYKVALDNQGNVLVLGQISGWHDAATAQDAKGKASFEDQTLDITIMMPSMLAKISPDGTTQWVKLSNGMPTLNQLALDGANNIYMSGHAMHVGGWGDVEIKAKGLHDMVITKLDQNGDLAWYKNYGVGTGPYKQGDLDQDKILGMAVSASGDITVIGQIQSGGSIEGKKVVGEGLMNMAAFIAGFSTDGTLGELEVMDLGKTGMLLGAIFKPDADGNICALLNPLKPFTYGKEKIKDPGIYRFSNDTNMEQIGKITGMELKGYLVTAWDFLPAINDNIFTVGNLSTLADAANSKVVKKFWDKQFEIPKGNPKTGVVYSRFSK